jgi:hypothetical protein
MPPVVLGTYKGGLEVEVNRCSPLLVINGRHLQRCA